MKTPQVDNDALTEYRKDEAIAQIDIATATLKALGYESASQAIRKIIDAEFPDDSERY